MAMSNENNEDRPCRITERRGEVPLSDGGRVTLDRILTVLNNPRRRYLISYLDESESAHIAEAAQYIAACEKQCELDDVPVEVRDHVKINMHHIHLPKLADLDLIEYDQRSGDIRFRDPPNRLLDFLELAEDTENINKPEIDSN